ncbi:hypothetical protein NFJ02_07g130830 [Pycnococcus provasolii]
MGAAVAQTAAATTTTTAKSEHTTKQLEDPQTPSPPPPVSLSERLARFRKEPPLSPTRRELKHTASDKQANAQQQQQRQQAMATAMVAEEDSITTSTSTTTHHSARAAAFPPDDAYASYRAAADARAASTSSAEPADFCAEEALMRLEARLATQMAEVDARAREALERSTRVLNRPSDEAAFGWTDAQPQSPPRSSMSPLRLVKSAKKAAKEKEEEGDDDDEDLLASWRRRRREEQEMRASGATSSWEDLEEMLDEDHAAAYGYVEEQEDVNFALLRSVQERVSKEAEEVARLIKSSRESEELAETLLGADDGVPLLADDANESIAWEDVCAEASAVLAELDRSSAEDPFSGLRESKSICDTAAEDGEDEVDDSKADAAVLAEPDRSSAEDPLSGLRESTSICDTAAEDGEDEVDDSKADAAVLAEPDRSSAEDPLSGLRESTSICDTAAEDGEDEVDDSKADAAEPDVLASLVGNAVDDFFTSVSGRAGRGSLDQWILADPPVVSAALPSASDPSPADEAWRAAARAPTEEEIAALELAVAAASAAEDDEEERLALGGDGDDDRLLVAALGDDDEEAAPLPSASPCLPPPTSPSSRPPPLPPPPTSPYTIPATLYAGMPDDVRGSLVGAPDDEIVRALQARIHWLHGELAALKQAKS